MGKWVEIKRSWHDATLTKQGWWCERLNPPPDEPVGDKIAGTCKTCNGPQFHRFVKATPDAPAVKITQCKACDSRTCGTVFRNGWGVAVKCDSKAFTGDAERPATRVSGRFVAHFCRINRLR